MYGGKDNGNENREGLDEVWWPEHPGSRSPVPLSRSLTRTVRLPATPLSSSCRIAVYTEKRLFCGLSRVSSSLPRPSQTLHYRQLTYSLPHLLTRTTAGDGDRWSMQLKRKDLGYCKSKKMHLWSKHNSVEKSQLICRKLVYI